MHSRLAVNISCTIEAPSAADDLKGLRPDVVDVLLKVMHTELCEVPRVDTSQDEGRALLSGSTWSWNWRRGITADDRELWDATSTPPSDAVRLAAEYVIVYTFVSRSIARLRRFPMPMDYPGFFVWRVLHNAELPRAGWSPSLN